MQSAALGRSGHDWNGGRSIPNPHRTHSSSEKHGSSKPYTSSDGPGSHCSGAGQDNKSSGVHSSGGKHRLVENHSSREAYASSRALNQGETHGSGEKHSSSLQQGVSRGDGSGGKHGPNKTYGSSNACGTTPAHASGKKNGGSGMQGSSGMGDKSGKQTSSKGHGTSKKDHNRTKQNPNGIYARSSGHHKSASNRYDTSTRYEDGLSGYGQEDNGHDYGGRDASHTRTSRVSQDGLSEYELGSLHQERGLPSRGPGLQNTLHVITYQQCGCSLTTTTYHWSLWLSNEENPFTGTLYHSSYISNQTVNSSVANISHSFGGNYRSGYMRIEDYQPGNSRNVRGVHAVARGVSDADIHLAGQEADRENPYNIASNNCQNWVIRVLRKLRDRGFISAQDYTRAAQMPAPSHFANWN